MQQPEPEPQSFDRVLSSMCTEPHPAARAAAERFLATNPGDPATYETVAAAEARAVERLAALPDWLPEALVSGVYGLDSFERAFAADDETIKTAVQFDAP